MKWCCERFNNLFSEAGERGFAILVEKNTFGLTFLIQCRSVKEISDKPLNLNQPISLVSETGILYCPWCGVRLEKYYKNYQNDILGNQKYRIKHDLK